MVEIEVSSTVYGALLLLGTPRDWHFFGRNDLFQRITTHAARPESGWIVRRADSPSGRGYFFAALYTRGIASLSLRTDLRVAGG